MLQIDSVDVTNIISHAQFPWVRSRIVKKFQKVIQSLTWPIGDLRWWPTLLSYQLPALKNLRLKISCNVPR